MSIAPAPSTAGLPALREAALREGLPDPVRLADELLAIDAERLREWFTVAGRAAGWLRQGSDRLSDAVPALGAGWSNPAPRTEIAALRDAGMSSRAVIIEQVQAADLACGALQQVKWHVDAELTAADAAVARLGPGGPPVLGSLPDGRPELMGILHGLIGRIDELSARATAELQSLALALRADPRDPIEAVPDRRGAVPPGAPSVPGARLTAPSAGSASIDTENLQRLERDLDSTDDATREMAVGVESALARARAAGGVAQLLLYESADSGSQGRAAISVGDIGTADNVATLVPGVTNAPAAMSDGVRDAANLRAEAERQSPGESTAVISWYGYDIPLSFVSGVPNDIPAEIDNALDALDDDNAIAGGALLARDLDRFGQWAPATARFTALGFSMGATTVSAAEAQGAMVDDVVLMGSPGASAEVSTAHDYPHLPADHAYLVAFDQDPVTRARTDITVGLLDALVSGPRLAGPFGPDPAGADFDAQVIDVTTNVAQVDVSLTIGGPMGWLTDPMASAAVQQVEDLRHHSTSNYLSGASGEAAAAVVLGHYTDVPIKPGR